MVVIVLWPEVFQKFSHLLGTQVASNLIFAGMILFLMLLFIEQSAELAKTNRNLRGIVTSKAASDFLNKKYSILKDGPTHGALIVLPCFNEEESIPKLIHELNLLKSLPHLAIDYCFIDDGSEDRSSTILNKLASNQYTAHSINLGVSAALLTGFKIAKHMNYSFVIQCDSDEQHPIKCIPAMLDYAVRSESDLLIGSRYVPYSNDLSSPFIPLPSTSPLRRIGSQLISVLLKLFGVHPRIFDPTSGFRVYSAKAINYLLKHMPDEYPEPESIAILARQRMKLREAYVEMRPRVTGASSLEGASGFLYMVKVLTALLGLRIRFLFHRSPIFSEKHHVSGSDDFFPEKQA